MQSCNLRKRRPSVSVVQIQRGQKCRYLNTSAPLRTPAICWRYDFRIVKFFSADFVTYRRQLSIPPIDRPSGSLLFHHSGPWDQPADLQPKKAKPPVPASVVVDNFDVDWPMYEELAIIRMSPKKSYLQLCLYSGNWTATDHQTFEAKLKILTIKPTCVLSKSSRIVLVS
jgi:hypothetical protein